MFEVDGRLEIQNFALVQTRRSLWMRHDCAFRHVEHGLTKTPHTALIDRPPAGPPRFEVLTAGHGVPLHIQQIAAITRVADLERIEPASARNALQPLTHTARTPSRAIGDTLAMDRTCSNA